MATINQLQDLEISRKGYLITPNTNLDFVGTTNNYKGVIGYDGNPNLISQVSTTSGENYLGRLMLWQLPIGTHYTSSAIGAEYIKVAMPLNTVPVNGQQRVLDGVTYTFRTTLTIPSVPTEILISTYVLSMDKCWKKIAVDSTTNGYVEKDTYNAYTVLAATNDNDPQPVNIGTNSLLGRIAGAISSISIDNDLTSVSGSDDTIPSAKAVVAYVNGQIVGALTFNGGYNVTADTTTADPTKKLQTAPYPVISKGDTYVITVAGNFFGTALGVGDMIISNQASPTTSSHWTLVIKNIPPIVSASESVEGIIKLATQNEVDSGQTSGEPVIISAVDEAKAVTPKKLAQRLYNLYTFLKTKFTRKAVITIGNTRTGTGTTLDPYIYTTNTTFPIPSSQHLLTNNTDLSITVKDAYTNETVYVDTSTIAEAISTNHSVIVKFSNPPTTQQYKVIIIG